MLLSPLKSSSVVTAVCATLAISADEAAEVVIGCLREVNDFWRRRLDQMSM